MKLLIVDTVSPDRAPYLKYYEDVCKKLKVNYDRFLWDRDHDGGLEYSGNTFLLHKICPFGKGKIYKILPMLEYRRNLLKVLKHGNYTHLVLINSLASFMIYNYVLENYKEHYIMDIRDYTYEKYSIYGRRINRLVSNSAFTTISSKGFLRFLDDNAKIVLNHNISNLANKIDEPTLLKRNPVSIGFVGSVRYQHENMQLIDSLKDNKKYELLFIGSIVNGCNLKSICEDKKIRNVFFDGKFNNIDKPKIYKNIDMINSIYGNFSMEVTTAVPNRYYDALLFKKPIITSKGTYLSELVENRGLGISIDVENDDIEEKISHYILHFDANKFVEACNTELNRVDFEQKEFIGKLEIFMSS